MVSRLNHKSPGHSHSFCRCVDSAPLSDMLLFKVTTKLGSHKSDDTETESDVQTVDFSACL